MSGARRKWAWPLVPLYVLGQAVREKLRGKPKELDWPVVSVGSLSAGGAGKTPVVIALAKLLTKHGWQVDVLSRGYGRKGKGVEQVEGEDAVRFGDEPVLISRATGVPVWVGAKRFSSGKKAEAAGAAGEKRVHLLDDGFQHRGLARTVDVALVTTEDMDDVLVPAGNLREKKDALGRANVVVMRDTEFKRVRPRLSKYIHHHTNMWLVRRTLRFEGPLGVMAAGTRPVAFCAIARPDGFAIMLANAGCKPVAAIPFDDHHVFSNGDIIYLLNVARERRATGFVTTEKDAVKLTAEHRARLERVGPVMVAYLEAVFEEEEHVVRDIEARILARAEGKPA